MIRKPIPALLLFLLACGAACGAPPRGDATPSAAPSPTVEASPTLPLPEPSPTALPPLVILLAPDTADPTLSTALQAELNRLAPQYGLRWQIRQTMTGAEVAAEAAYLVALPPGAEVAELVAAAPGTRFLAVGIPGLPAAPNLINIGSESAPAEIPAFMGGYIGALITADWRIGMIGVEGESETAELTAFENGMRFFCGLCRPQYAPFYEYPFLATLPASASEEEWRALADFMRDRLVGTVYVGAGAGSADLLEHLASLGVNVVGRVSPPDGARGHYVASLRTDLTAAYMEYLPRLLGGETGISAPLPLLLADVNPDLLPAGRLRLVQQTLADVQAGYILTGGVP